MEHLYWIVPSVIVAASALLFWVVGRKSNRQGSVEPAGKLFQEKRPRLESLFFKVASSLGKPRGLRWKECQWNELIEWVRDKQTGQILALVGVTISFEAVEGGDMEGVEAVGNPRNASAVFFFQDGRWQTAGRVIFNLNPSEAVDHFKAGYERVSF